MDLSLELRRHKINYDWTGTLSVLYIDDPIPDNVYTGTWHKLQQNYFPGAKKLINNVITNAFKRSITNLIFFSSSICVNSRSIIPVIHRINNIQNTQLSIISEKTPINLILKLKNLYPKPSVSFISVYIPSLLEI